MPLPGEIRVWLEHLDELGQTFVSDLSPSGSVWNQINALAITSLEQNGLIIKAPHKSPVAPDEACYQLMIPSNRPAADGFKLTAKELASSAFTTSALLSLPKVQNMLRESDPRHALPIIVLGKCLHTQLSFYFSCYCRDSSSSIWSSRSTHLSFQ